MIKDLFQQVRIKKYQVFFKDELGGKNIEEICALRSKAYSYRMDDGSEKRKAKGTKKCIIRSELMFEN